MITRMAEIAKPLYGVLDRDEREREREKNKRQKLLWTEQMNKAFTVLKNRAANSIALNIIDFSKKFVFGHIC